MKAFKQLNVNAQELSLFKLKKDTLFSLTSSKMVLVTNYPYYSRALVTQLSQLFLKNNYLLLEPLNNLALKMVSSPNSSPLLLTEKFSLESPHQLS
jgi:ABC-type enterochelin transport system ATPase subunit